MNKYEMILLFAGTFCYFLTASIYLFTVGMKRDLSRFGWYSLLLGFGLHSAAILVRWNITGHPPVMYEYESALAGSWTLVACFIGLQKILRKWDWIPLAISAVAVINIVNGLRVKTELVPLAPPYRSYWLWFHLGFAWTAFAAFIIGTVFALMYIFGARRDADGAGGDDLATEMENYEDFSLRFVAFGFVFEGMMIATGSIWAKQLWGSYWNWDPLETWSLVSWLIYAFVLHMRVVIGWRGTMAAWLTVAAVAGLLITYGGIGFISGMHTPLL